MKDLVKKYTGKKVRISIISAVLLLIQDVFAQIPKGVPQPHQNEPVSSLGEVIFYFVIPVILIIIYLIWRRQVKKRKAKENAEKENKNEVKDQ